MDIAHAESSKLMQPDWKKLGFLTPDAFLAQQETWALLARLHVARSEVLVALADRTAEPTWGATLSEAAARAAQLAEQLDAESSEEGRLSVSDDIFLSQVLEALDEIVQSGHVASLLVCGHGPLGALTRLPAQLLEEVAGEYAKPICQAVLDEGGDPLLLARLFTMSRPDKRTADGLRRLLRHLNGGLAEVYGARRQDLHTLGIDGEWIVEQGRETVRRVHHELELPCTQADISAIGRFG